MISRGFRALVQFEYFATPDGGNQNILQSSKSPDFHGIFLQIHIFKESVRLQNNLCSLSKQNTKRQQGIILFATTLSPVRVQANMNRMRNV